MQFALNPSRYQPEVAKSITTKLPVDWSKFRQILTISLKDPNSELPYRFLSGFDSQSLQSLQPHSYSNQYLSVFPFLQSKLTVVHAESSSVIFLILMPRSVNLLF